MRTHAAWVAQVAEPILRNGTTVARQTRGKDYIDRFRAANASIDQAVSLAATGLRDRAQQDLGRGVALFASAVVLVIGAVVMLGSSQRRLRSDLERERGIVASLQRAFVSRHQVVPSIDVGVAYRSATQGTSVGGDVFDVSLLTDRRALIMVADVSGKGVGAAVETAFVKYAIRALARAAASPAEILRQLNQMYGQDADRWGSGSFIVLFLAILDLQTHALRYASAGHGSAFLRRDASVQTLAVTGPALGIIDDADYGEERLELRPSDALLVVTDGLTESRDGRGALLTEDGVAEWFSHSSRSASAQTVVDAMLERAFERAGGHIGDDLAVVCARVMEIGERPAARSRVILSSPRLPSPL
jgi:serine phosphatase RsbU (regulator of sigma subunit)